MAEKPNDDFQKLDDLDSLLNSALNELNNPHAIKDDETNTDDASYDKIEDLNQLTDTFKKLMDSSNDAAFDESMLETLRKLEENVKNMPDDLPNEGDMANIWAQMTNQTEGGGDDVFPAFFLDIMQKLLAKDVLYPPLKELSEKFPDWLGENKDQITDEEFQRYSKQHELVDQVCSYYEEQDEGPIENKRFQKILTAMQEMQQLGQPPEQLVSQQNPGFTPPSIDDFNKMMEDTSNLDQCKTM